MNTSLQIKNLTREDILTHIDALAAILENCVNAVHLSVLCCPLARRKPVRSGAALPSV